MESDKILEGRVGEVVQLFADYPESREPVLDLYGVQVLLNKVDEIKKGGDSPHRNFLAEAARQAALKLQTEVFLRSVKDPNYGGWVNSFSGKPILDSSKFDLEKFLHKVYIESRGNEQKTTPLSISSPLPPES